jgi:hypothetical protein
MVDSVLEVQNIKLPDSGGVTSSTAITLDASGVANFPNGLTYNSEGFLGLDQTWQDVTSSRSLGTTYTNSSGKPIFISVRIDGPNSKILSVDSVQIVNIDPANSGRQVVYAIIPNDSTYSISSSDTLVKWCELR